MAGPSGWTAPIRALSALSIVVAALVAPTALAQISPGPLARAHSVLEGAKNCLECHAGGEGSMSRQCRDCHEEIDWLIENGRGLHARTEAECATCHPDHVGAEFDLVGWDHEHPASFDHEETGWSLRGKHATLRCKACHTREKQAGPVREILDRRKARAKWLGLEGDCLACHEDRHRGTLDPDCRSCHNYKAWTPAPRFDHGRTRYPLTGRHADVVCNKCHLVPGRVSEPAEDGTERPLYRPLAHQQCTDCHEDTHAGRLGPKCDSCHTTVGFAVVSALQFDHSRTRYPLTGAHTKATCESCHDPDSAFGKRPAFDRCDRCHDRRAHGEQATLRGRSVDCAACHDERSFRPSTFTVADHADTAYALEGAHAKVACASCHDKPGAATATLGAAGVRIRRAHERCRDCHTDAHAGQFDARDDGGACESCHRVGGWRPSTYTVEQHATLELPLEGRHAEVDCRACHSASRKGLPPLPGPEVLGTAAAALTALPSDCAACHFDPHEGRFAVSGERPAADGCRTCHDATRFAPSTVGSAIHREFAFALEGAHRATPCAACHEELASPGPRITLLAVEGPPRELRFTRLHDACSLCHATPHGDQFDARVPAPGCDDCHDQRAFRPAPRFDHDRDSAFPLDGAHRKVRCASCHKPQVGEDGRSRVIYRPLKRRCQDCHRGNLPRTLEVSGSTGDRPPGEPS